MSKNRTHIPAADKVAAALRVQASQLATGSRLPSVRQMMRQFAVSQLTVQQAISALERDGMVERQLGRGIFVAGGPGPAARTVTLLRGDLPSRRGDEVTRAVHLILKDAGHRPLVVTYSDYQLVEQTLRDAPRPDACVIQPVLTQIPIELLAFLRRHSDNVVVDGQVQGVSVDSIVTDWRGGLDLAVKTLIDLGHRQIALVSGEPPFTWEPLTRYFLTLCQWANLPMRSDSIVATDAKPGRLPGSALRERFSQIIREHRKLPFTAIVVNSFASAVGALEALEAAQIHVPDELSMIVLDSPDLGVDTRVPLTMVGHTSLQTAQQLVARVEARWENPALRFECIEHAPQLVERQSTAAPARNPGDAADMKKA